MAVGVLSDGDRGDFGADAFEDLGQSWVGAAVVGQLHGVDVGEREREERLALGVAGEEQFEAVAADDGDDGARVGVLGRRAWRARDRGQDVDPQRTGVEGQRGERGDTADSAGSGRGDDRVEVAVAGAVAAVDQQVDREALDDLGETAVVVARSVRHHDRRQPPDPGAAQQPCHAALGRSAVEQHGAAVGVLDERGVALADVEEADRQRRAAGGPA